MFDKQEMAGDLYFSHARLGGIPDRTEYNRVLPSTPVDDLPPN